MKKPLVFFPSPSPSLLFFYYTRDKSFDSLCVKQTYTHMCMCVVFQRSFYLWYVYRRQRRVFPIIFFGIFPTNRCHWHLTTKLIVTPLLFLFCVLFQYYAFYCLPISREKSSVPRACVYSFVLLTSLQFFVFWR